jgi:hypothetical protein
MSATLHFTRGERVCVRTATGWVSGVVIDRAFGWVSIKTRRGEVTMSAKGLLSSVRKVHLVSDSKFDLRFAGGGCG